MTLNFFYQSLPRGERRIFARRLADDCGVTEAAVMHWCNGTRKPPADTETRTIIKRATGWQVTDHGLRPEIFEPEKGREALTEQDNAA